jgi:hypothetical protein
MAAPRRKQIATHCCCCSSRCAAIDAAVRVCVLWLCHGSQTGRKLLFRLPGGAPEGESRFAVLAGAAVAADLLLLWAAGRGWWLLLVA